VRAEIAALELRRLSWPRVRGGVEAIAEEFAEHDLLTYSSAIAFQVIYAVIPLSFLAIAALGVFGAESLYTDHIAPTLRHSLSKDAFAIANRTALRAMNGKKVWWTTAGVLVTLWGSGAALRSMMTPLNAVYDADETRSWLRRLLVSIGGGALAIACVIGALLIAWLVPLVNLSGALSVIVTIARWAATLCLLAGAIAAILWTVPAKRRPLEWVSVGSALCMICWIVATIGFGAYISAVSYASFYGALAGVVLLMIYLHVTAIAFLLGVVVDSLLRDEIKKQERRRR
jgi:membrane protein